MREIFSFGVSQQNTRFTLFVFFSLFIFSAAFFVFADNIVGAKNIFQDSDQDGLSNDEEKLYGTDPFEKDSDGDGYSDGVEVESGYDPLKPAPGDKIVKQTTSESVTQTPQKTENLTEKVSDEITEILENAGQGGDSVSLEDIDESVQKILSENNNEEIILPEVNIDDIKIKKGPSKSLSEEKRKEQERDDAVEYLTVVAYLVANNSPRAFYTENDLNSMLTWIVNDSFLAMSSGNMEFVHQLSEYGEKVIEELKDIEVPEKMLDSHIKALKVFKYAMQLKEELATTQNDPIGKIAVLSKVQGLLGNVMGFTDEVYRKLAEYDIQTIPLDL